MSFVQRFGGALNLNVHFHCVIPDGVFVREEGSVRFIALPGPSDDEVTEVLAHALRSGAFGASIRVELALPGPPN